MKKIIFCCAIMFGLAWVANAQAVPPKITTFLNKFYTGWKEAPGTCDNKGWMLRGDFDGDRKLDYLFRIKFGKTSKSMKLNLVAFLNYAPNYIPIDITEDKYTGNLKTNSSFKIMKKGETVGMGESGGTSIKLKADAVMQYICETDDVRIFIYEGGKWRDLYQ